MCCSGLRVNDDGEKDDVWAGHYFQVTSLDRAQGGAQGGARGREAMADVSQHTK